MDGKSLQHIIAMAVYMAIVVAIKIIFVSLITKAPSQEIIDDFDAVCAKQ